MSNFLENICMSLANEKKKKKTDICKIIHHEVSLRLKSLKFFYNLMVGIFYLNQVVNFFFLIYVLSLVLTNPSNETNMINFLENS